MRQVMRLLGVFFVSATFASAVSATGDAELSSIIQECNDCHGKNGVSTEGDMPTIAGASSFFIEEQMFAYQESARPCEKSKFRSGDTSRAPKDMCEIAKGLSEKQVQALAAHYSEQKFVPAKQQVDLAKAAQGGIVHGDLCEKCHTEAGSVAEDDAGILAGQWMAYMQQSFKEYRNNKRPDIKKMTTAFGKISDADAEALLHYYACMGNAQAGTVKPEQCAAAE